jgi:hypothetical protein
MLHKSLNFSLCRFSIFIMLWGDMTIISSYLNIEALTKSGKSMYHIIWHLKTLHFAHSVSFVFNTILTIQHVYSLKHLIFVWTCIIETNNIDNPTRCNINGLLIIPINLTCFGRWSRPPSGALDCVYSLWYNAPTMLPVGRLKAESLRFQTTGRQHRGCTIPQAVNTV